MSLFTQPEEVPRKATNSAAMVTQCHFCVVVNQWCRGTAASGKPDDCINCGRCEQQED
jgi:ferredoxin